MTVLRMDHVSVVVDDLDAATAFFVALGLRVDGEAPVRGRWVDEVNALDDVQVVIRMLRTPDGHGALELTRFDHPAASGGADAPPNTLGLRSVMFEVDDLDAALAAAVAHGGELVGRIARYGDAYRLCYLRGPAGVIVALAQPLGDEG